MPSWRDPSELIEVNAFLREFGGAVAASPHTNVAVALQHHPATRGVNSVTRPGRALGAWCLQGAPLARMAGTPIVVVRNYGAGRVAIADAGLAVDRAQSAAGKKTGPTEYGIHLRNNRDLILRTIGWLRRFRTRLT